MFMYKIQTTHFKIPKSEKCIFTSDKVNICPFFGNENFLLAKRSYDKKIAKTATPKIVNLVLKKELPLFSANFVNLSHYYGHCPFPP